MRKADLTIEVSNKKIPNLGKHRINLIMGSYVEKFDATLYLRRRKNDNMKLFFKDVKRVKKK